MKKIGVIFLLSVVFLGCQNNDKDYVYNEVTASQYKQVSDFFERVYKKFGEGYYSTKFESVDDIEAMRLTKEVQQLKEQANDAKERIDGLERSTDTDKMHETISAYFSTVSGDFADALNAYAAIDCDCPERKDSIIGIVKNRYRQICDIEDKALEEQKIMFEKAGFRAK